MEYLVVTAKHHDGWCLWDTRLTAFNSMRAPCGRDLIAEIAAACRRGGLRMGLYYSVVDWHHPAYPNQGRHHELPAQAEDTPDMPRYVDFVKAQVEELVTRYGEIASWFWDMNVPQWQDPSVNAIIRQHQPGCIINDRGFGPGDLGSAEREYHPGIMAQRRFSAPTEHCTSVGRWSWGYKADEDYFSAKHLRYLVAGVLGKGGNELLNIGPDAEGRIPRQAQRLLGDLGTWYKTVQEAFRGTEPASHLTTNEDVLLTRRGRSLFVILHREPAAAGIPLLPLAMEPMAATLLNDGRPVDWLFNRLPMAEAPVTAKHLRLRQLPLELAAVEPLVVRLDFGQDLRLPQETTPNNSSQSAGSPTDMNA